MLKTNHCYGMFMYFCFLIGADGDGDNNGNNENNTTTYFIGMSPGFNELTHGRRLE